MSAIDDQVADNIHLNMEDKEDWSFQAFTTNPMSSPMNDDDQRNIEEINADLKNKLKEWASSSASTSNNLPQENVGDKNNMKKQQQLEIINGDTNSSTNSNPNDMDIDDVCRKFEQIYSNVDTKTNNEQHFDNINKNNGKLLIQGHTVKHI
jgi:hypothetical protein